MSNDIFSNRFIHINNMIYYYSIFEPHPRVIYTISIVPVRGHITLIQKVALNGYRCVGTLGVVCGNYIKLNDRIFVLLFHYRCGHCNTLYVNKNYNLDFVIYRVPRSYSEKVYS